MDVDLGGRVVKFELARSARARWARLEIHLHRGVRVVLPQAAPLSDAESLVRSKSQWLLRHLARFDRLRSLVPDRRLVTGERLPYLGGELTLDVSSGPPRIERRGETLAVSLPSPTTGAVRIALEDWYAAEAEEEFGRRVDEAAARFRIRVRRVRISRAHTRWGTCSATGRISLNWRLMLAPPAIVDYLVAHELSHVGHPNHSDAFWTRVEKLCPGWREAERWLKKMGKSLII